MAERFWEDARILEDLSKEEDSSRELGFHLPTGDFIPGSEDNIANSGANERAWGEGGSIDADKADEELSAEGGPPVTRRPRGRPLGSRNKPKGPLHGIREITETAKCLTLEIPSGLNVTDIVESFMGSSDLGVVVIGGRGNVTNVNLSQAFHVGDMVGNKGPLEIISLTGAFPRGVDTRGGTGLKVTLTDAQGNHIGGTVVSLIAYGTVLVTLNTIMNINRDVLNEEHPGLLLSPAVVPAQQHFQSPNMMTMQQQIGIGASSPTLMTVQQQIGLVPANYNAMPNLAIGAVRPHSYQLIHNVMPNLEIGAVRSNQQDPMDSVMRNLAMGSVRPNYPELINNVMPNMAIGSVTPNSEEPTNNVMSNLVIGSVTPNSNDMIPDERPQHSWF